MKNLDLNSYGVQEMDAKAMEEANGGFWPIVVKIVVSAICIVGGHLAEETTFNPDPHAAAWNRGKEAALRDNRK